MSAFLEKHKELLPTQYGFQKNTSTTHALLDVVSNSFDQLNSKNYVGLLLIDFKRSFDTASHEILLMKLDHSSIRGPCKNFIASFLTDRTQFVSSSGIKSTTLLVAFGVSQGSILGPLLFLLYINDLHNAISCTRRLFENDTCLFFSSNKLSSLETYMNHDLDKFRVWAIANKLTLDSNKSHDVIISPKYNNNMNSCNDISLNYGKSKILINNCCKYLGILVDSSLNFAFHIKNKLKIKLLDQLELLANKNICCLRKHYCFCITQLSIPISCTENRFGAIPILLI